MATVKEHCCGADLFFDQKTAEKQYKQYIKKGATRVTRNMIRQLEDHLTSQDTLLDIGGGIGALQWWFLQNIGNNTTGVDASNGYINIAEGHARNCGWQEQTRFIFGDFTEVQDQIDRADVVTLDKVVCCYPNYQDILLASCEKTKQFMSLSYPMDGPVARAFAFLGLIRAKIRGDAFRPYVHKVEDIRKLIENEGFERVALSWKFPWHIETYRRAS